MNSIKTLLASGFSVVDGAGELDDGNFDFEPETPKKIVESMVMEDAE